MVDRVYKAGLPRLRNALEELREAFSHVDSGTNWAELRIGPLLKHVESLERLLASEEFSEESARLRRGVRMFHSDLVYLRSNVEWLKEILQSKQTSRAKR